uniref:Uncharacterized protein n=1 Tax=Romanomermis culicivorax TaxID=13658 RepID=A0A915HKU1_ROMCU
MKYSSKNLQPVTAGAGLKIFQSALAVEGAQQPRKPGKVGKKVVPGKPCVEERIALDGRPLASPGKIDDLIGDILNNDRANKKILDVIKRELLRKIKQKTKLNFCVKTLTNRKSGWCENLGKIAMPKNKRKYFKNIPNREIEDITI